MKEKYLSLKMLFNLMDELKKKESFEDIFEEIFRQYKNNPKDLEKIHESYINDNKDSFYK